MNPHRGPKSQLLWDSKGNQNDRTLGLEGSLASKENRVQRQHAIYMCSSPKISYSEVVPDLFSTVLLPQRNFCPPTDSRWLGAPIFPRECVEARSRALCWEKAMLLPRSPCTVLTFRTASPGRFPQNVRPLSYPDLLLHLSQIVALTLGPSLDLLGPQALSSLFWAKQTIRAFCIVMCNVFKSQGADPVWGICMFTRIESWRTETLKGINPWEGHRPKGLRGLEGWVGNLERSSPRGRGLRLSREAPLHQGSQGDWLTYWSWASSKRLQGTSLSLLLRHSQVKIQGVAIFTSWPDSSPCAIRPGSSF